MRPGCLIAWLAWVAVATAPGHALDTAPESGPPVALSRLAVNEQTAMENRGMILEDPSVTTFLQHVADHLWKHVPTDLPAPVVDVVADTHINAYAYPNGRCYVSTGMLAILDNESQLAMIVAHEIVHYVRQHTTALYDHLRDGRAGPTDGNARHRNTADNRRIVLNTVEAAERQADSEGLAMIMRAGYDTAQVVPLMNALIRQMSLRGYTATVGQLEHRLTYFQAHGAGPAPHDDNRGMHDYLAQVAPALMANAQAAVRRGEWDQAARSVARFLLVRPADARAYYLKGEISRRDRSSGPVQNCIGSYLKAIELDPSFPPVHRALGELYYKAGRYQLAKPYFETFLSLAPTDSAREFIKGYLRQCQN